MQDTRETLYRHDSGKTKENAQPRFKPGDTVLISHNGELIPQTPRSVMWDKEFGGWLLFCHLIGVHDLWSWWERKTVQL